MWGVTPHTPLRSCMHFRWTPPSPTSCIRTKMMFPFSSKKHIKIFEYRVHWNINIWKNKFLYEKLNGREGWNKYSNITISVMSCTVATFVRKNSGLLARKVSFDTAGLHLLTSQTLEPYLSKDIVPDLTHAISH